MLYRMIFSGTFAPYIAIIIQLGLLCCFFDIGCHSLYSLLLHGSSKNGQNVHLKVRSHVSLHNRLPSLSQEIMMISKFIA